MNHSDSFAPTTAVSERSEDAATPTKARIAVFTVRRFAIEHMLAAIASRPDAEIACVLTCPGPKSRRSPAHCEVLQAMYDNGFHHIDVICSNQKSKWADLVAQYNANCIFCSGFPWLIPTSVLDDTRLPLGVINFHNSILPQLMGPNAFGWQIVNGQSSIGYCVHRMSAEFDTGPILFTETVPLDVNEDYQDLQLKMPAIYTGMVHRAVEMAIARHPGFPQVGTPSAAPKFPPEFRYIDFTHGTALDAHNKVRAYFGVRDHPHGALARVDGDLLCITKTRYHAPVKVVGAPLLLEENERNDPSASIDEVLSLTTTSTDTNTIGGESAAAEGASIPGTVLVKCGASFLIQCRDTSLEVLEWHKVSEPEDA